MHRNAMLLRRAVPCGRQKRKGKVLLPRQTSLVVARILVGAKDVIQRPAVVVAVSHFLAHRTKKAPKLHRINMPSSQPRSPPLMLPFPRAPISGKRGAGLCAWSSLSGAKEWTSITDVGL
jgi:hypothetical protein